MESEDSLYNTKMIGLSEFSDFSEYNKTITENEHNSFKIINYKFPCKKHISNKCNIKDYKNSDEIIVNFKKK